MQIADAPPPLPYEPIYCKGACRSILNPFVQVDYRSRVWICPLCGNRNNFPHHYADISETNLPAELIPQFTTIEYQLQRPPAPPPVFLLVVDTSGKEKELQALKDSIIMALNLIPENARVGLITFGTTVQVHEIASEDLAKCYVFRGCAHPSASPLPDAPSFLPTHAPIIHVFPAPLCTLWPGSRSVLSA